MSQWIEFEPQTEREDDGDLKSPDPEVNAPLGPGMDDDDYEPAPIPFPLIVLLEAGLAPVALLIGLLVDQHPLGRFSWTLWSPLRAIVATIPMLALLALTLRWPIGPLRRIRDFFDHELRPAMAGARWYDLALLSLAAGLGEEMLFRGVLQAAAARWFGPIAGVTLASFLFGLLHPVSPAYVVLAALLGAYLGTILLIDGNLLTVVLAHALYDFVAMTVLLRRGEPTAPPSI